MKRQRPILRQWSSQRGQTFLVIAIFVSVFLLASLGLATDYAQIWAHRQMSQGAADAACQAGAADLLLQFENPQAPTSYPQVNFGWIGSAYNCSTNTSSPPCQYALQNGYSGANVAVSFPSSLPGAPAIPPGFGSITHAYIQVTVTDNVPMLFTRLAGNPATVPVAATAGCGMVAVNVAIPITILNPTASGTLSLGGASSITIYGGPQRSVDVNSGSATALSAGSDLNLSYAGPSYTGGDIGVFGGPATNPGVLLGSTGHYLSPAAPITDPFATVPTPTTSGLPVNPPSTPVAYNINGCPDSSGCAEYVPGYYKSGISISGTTAIFDPGTYYVSGGINLGANSTVRPSSKNATTAPYGTIFYLTGCTTCISVGANSGKKTLANSFSSSSLTCPGGSPYTAPPGVTPPTQGNILMAPCTGTYGDPSGVYRGILFFVDHSISGATAGWGGGGQFIMAGAFYVHNTTSSNDTFTLGGNSGSTSLILGNLVADQVSMSGTPSIDMQLNPNSSYQILKVQLLQ